MNLFQAINYRMHGPGCPTQGSLGECAAMFDQGDYWEAYVYLWPAAESIKAADVAAWFTDLGCTHIGICAILHEPGNQTFEGRCPDGARPWIVRFYPPAHTQQDKP